MTEWKKVKIEDIGDLSNGINFNKSAYTKGVKLIGVADFKDRLYPDYDSLQEVNKDVVRDIDYLHAGDIVFVRSNGNKELVGRCMLIEKDLSVTYSGFCIRLRIRDIFKFNPLFFAYLFKSNTFRKAMSGTAVGANIQNLNQKRLGNYAPLVPDVNTQKKISNILSKYDSLIENYQQQIKLLEEAAQRLYKEWFVNLHFPGYENTKIVDGVPEGWEKVLIGDMLEKVKRTKQIPTSEMLNVGRFPVIDQSKNYVAGYTNDRNSVIDSEIPLIIFGDHTRVLKFIPFSFARGADGTQVLLSKDLERMPQTLFFLSLKNVDLSNYSYARHFKYLKAEEILVPSKDSATKFDYITTRWSKKIYNLRSQIRLLTEARDRLLPKLMSGDIAVEKDS